MEQLVSNPTVRGRSSANCCLYNREGPLETAAFLLSFGHLFLLVCTFALLLS